jgi:rhamnose transport system permease protein
MEYASLASKWSRGTPTPSPTPAIFFINQATPEGIGDTLTDEAARLMNGDKAFSETQAILKAFPTAKLIMSIAAPAVPGAAEAVQQSGRKDIFVIGLSLPNLCKKYVHDGVVQAVVLWNTRDLGYLTVYTSTLLAQNQLQAGVAGFDAGRLGRIEVRGSKVILGKPMIFNKANIDLFDF